jgi:hypothetical protein
MSESFSRLFLTYSKGKKVFCQKRPRLLQVQSFELPCDLSIILVWKFQYVVCCLKVFAPWKVPNRFPTGSYRFPTGSQQVPCRFPTGSQHVPSRFPTGSPQVPHRFPTGSPQVHNRFTTDENSEKMQELSLKLSSIVVPTTVPWCHLKSVLLGWCYHL